ncbi:hypothetical protein TIFTF001_029623 [Ficus carica]|uniref:Uncharacterized protein n=1 Tax=Ficus carica TaxID=3494 RepID=A0AA88DW86_FICCA|nr:hypothetical protein TIFTF001_029623 [Ficus carica]
MEGLSLSSISRLYGMAGVGGWGRAGTKRLAKTSSKERCGLSGGGSRRCNSATKGLNSRRI